MRTKNLTPFPLGTKLTARRPPQREVAVIVRGRFRLRPGEPLRPLQGLVEQGGLTADAYAEGDDDRAGECLYPGDFADFKLRAEVMLKGACHPPGGRAASECDVRFSVGGWSKALRVIGRRVWTEKVLGQAISTPAPFVTMPLRWANAFGGVEHPQNPVGKGLGTPELPTVEYPGAPLRSKNDRPPPAGLGPINPAWQPRAGKVGKEYGAAWRRERAPFSAVDFDWSYFSAAPADQQIEGYLRGDEEVGFRHLHPEAATFSVRLPGLRLRALVKNVGGAVHDVPMSLDTLFADLDEEVLSLTWRGLAPVAEDDLSDVQTVLIASEPLAEAPLPLPHYVAVLEAFEADPLERDKNLPPKMKKLIDDAKRPDRPPTDALRAMIGERIAELPPEQRASAERAVAQMDEVVKRSATGESATNVPRAEKVARLRALAERIRGLREQAAREGAPGVDEIDAALADPAMAKLLDPSAAEPGPGGDFSGEDLIEADLAGRDLSGASFERAYLLKAKLAGARLAGCNLRGALLAEADLTGADLSGADLTRAVLAGARAAGASFAGATVSQAIFDGADLTGASFERAQGRMVVFLSANLTRLSARGASLWKAIARQGGLEGADFTDADLTLCQFTEMKGAGVVLCRARLDRTSFAKSDLTRARIAEARGEGSIFTDATLDGADLTLAVLPEAHFTGARARGATFFGADLRGARFYRAVIDGAQLGRANLFGADMRKVSMHRSVFRAANLYDAKLVGAAGKDADFTDANVARVRYEVA